MALGVEDNLQEMTAANHAHSISGGHDLYWVPNPHPSSISSIGGVRGTRAYAFVRDIHDMALAASPVSELGHVTETVAAVRALPDGPPHQRWVY